MNQGGIFNGPTALGTSCAGCGQVDNFQPQAWWMQGPNTTAWWEETPGLLQPMQTRPWYAAETGAARPPSHAMQMGQKKGLIPSPVLPSLKARAMLMGEKKGIFSRDREAAVDLIGRALAASKGRSAVSGACGQADSEQLEPEAWWMKPIDDRPWWHETPTLLKPVQTQPWYLPEEQGPSTPEVIEAREQADSMKTGLIVTGVLAGLVLLAGALGGRVY